MQLAAPFATAVLLVAALAACSSGDPEADKPEPTSSPSGASQASQGPVVTEPEISEYEGTFTGDIVITAGTFEAFAKGDRNEDASLLVSCPDTECATADLRLDLSTGSSFNTTMALTREGDTFTGDAQRTNPCPSGEGQGKTLTDWDLTLVSPDKLEGRFDLEFIGCGISGKAKAKITAKRSAPTSGYLDPETGAAFVSAFAAYDASLAGVYEKYNACGELEGKAYASCVLALYRPWNKALKDFMEPLAQAGDAASGICAFRLKQVDPVKTDARQQRAIAVLEQHKRGSSPKDNETFIEFAVEQHESLMRAVLMCVAPSDMEPVVPTDGFALDLNDAALDT